LCGGGFGGGLGRGAVSVGGIVVVLVVGSVREFVVAVFKGDVGVAAGFFFAFGGGAADLAPAEVVFETLETRGVMADLEEDVGDGEFGGAAPGGEVAGGGDLGWRV
jgi:hypothetical protein